LFLRLVAIATVVALTFVKIFPFSSQLFAAAGALAFTWLLGSRGIHSWFEVKDGWLTTVGWGVLGGLAVVAADAATFSAYPLLGIAPMRLDRFADVHGHWGELLEWLVVIWLLVGVTEELISRAFLIDQWLEVLPTSRTSTALAILASSVTFSLVHYYEGLAGVISNFIAALILGSLYALRRRTLGSNVIAHSLADSLGLVAIYFGWVS